MLSDWIQNGIKNRIGPDLRPYVEKAFKLFILSNPNYRSEGTIDRFLIETIQSIAGKLLCDRKAVETEIRKNYYPRSEYSVDNVARSKKALERILPHIESLRQEIFGNESVPFASITSARRWLAKEARNEEALFHKERGNTAVRVIELEGQIEQLLKERNSLSPRAWILKHDRTVPVALGNYYDTFPGTKLRILSEDVAKLSEQSRFSMQALFAYILAGVVPIRKLMYIDILGPVTVRDFLDYYKQLPAWYKRSKKVTAIGNAVYNFVQERGGPPTKKVMKFWRETTKAWNKHRGHRKYESRDGLKKAYERALKRLPS
jgi:hypothetical protein